jgi:hypothetical protein
MNKQEYINLKKTNTMAIIYKYYFEKFDSKKHKSLLSEQEFYTYIQMTLDVNQIAVKVLNHYDQYYSVTTIFDKEGNVISYS